LTKITFFVVESGKKKEARKKRQDTRSERKD